jgi:hypothetical protein
VNLLLDEGADIEASDNVSKAHLDDANIDCQIFKCVANTALQLRLWYSNNSSSSRDDGDDEHASTAY